MGGSCAMSLPTLTASTVRMISGDRVGGDPRIVGGAEAAIGQLHHPGLRVRARNAGFPGGLLPTALLRLLGFG